MWLILCDPQDHPAIWAYGRLCERGLTPLEVVTPHELLCALESAHRVDADGASFDLLLADGRRLRSTEIRGVVNRVTWLPTEALATATEEDRLYAVAEWAAILASWFTCVRSVTLGSGSGGGLFGNWRPEMEWQQLAARAGLDVVPQRFSTHHVEPASPPATRSVLVLGEHVFGASEWPEVAAGCASVARLVGAELLGVDLDATDSRCPRFAGVVPLPDLTLGGDKFIDVLHTALCGRGAAS